MATSTIKYMNELEQGSLTKAHSNITSVEFATYLKVGRVCVIRLNFTVGTTISVANATLFTGAPKTVTLTRTSLQRVNARSTDYARVGVLADGSVQNQYTTGGITAGQYEGELVYITEE